MSKVFISCGQSKQEERAVAKEISEWFSSQGYVPYVAVETQNILDVNSGIINELERSDYYVFIDLMREELDNNFCRGSLFTNQELAIACFLRFEKTLFLKHNKIKLEGITQYMTSNAVTFEHYNEILPKIKCLVEKNEWTNTYSRHLILESLNLSEKCTYEDEVYKEEGKILSAIIKNKRIDIASFNTIARLEKYEYDGILKDSLDKKLLKVSGQSGYDQIIWPQSKGQFDLLLITDESPSVIYLNSLSDERPRKPLLTESNIYKLDYSVISENFPRLDFSISISFDNNIENFKYEIIKNTVNNNDSNPI